VIERLGPWSALLVVVRGNRVREHVAGGDFDAVAVPALGQKCPGGRVDGRALETVARSCGERSTRAQA
jgi:hypothetical protein